MKNHPVDSFEAWLKRPIFVAQCRSWALANKYDLACHRFRCLPAYRDEQAMTARKMVADMIRCQRKLAARKKVLIAQLKIVSQHNPVTGYLVDVQATINLNSQLHQLKMDETIVS